VPVTAPPTPSTASRNGPAYRIAHRARGVLRAVGVAERAAAAGVGLAAGSGGRDGRPRQPARRVIRVAAGLRVLAGVARRQPRAHRRALHPPRRRLGHRLHHRAQPRQPRARRHRAQRAVRQPRVPRPHPVGVVHPRHPPRRPVVPDRRRQLPVHPHRRQRPVHRPVREPHHQRGGARTVRRGHRRGHHVAQHVVLRGGHLTGRPGALHLPAQQVHPHRRGHRLPRPHRRRRPVLHRRARHQRITTHLTVHHHPLQQHTRRVERRRHPRLTIIEVLEAGGLLLPRGAQNDRRPLPARQVEPGAQPRAVGAGDLAGLPGLVHQLPAAHLRQRVLVGIGPVRRGRGATAGRGAARRAPPLTTAGHVVLVADRGGEAAGPHHRGGGAAGRIRVGDVGAHARGRARDHVIGAQPRCAGRRPGARRRRAPPPEAGPPERPAPGTSPTRPPGAPAPKPPWAR